MIFGWGGKAPNARNGHGPAVFSPDDRRGRARLAVRHRGRQAAWRHDDPADPRAGPRRTARRARDPLRRRDRPDARGDGGSPPPRPARDHGDRPSPGRARAGRLHEAVPARGRRGAPARGAERPGGDPARGREGRPRGDGRLGAAVRIRRRAVPVRGAARSRSRRARSRPSSSSRPASRSPAPRSTSSPPVPRRWPPPTGRPRRSARSRLASTAGSASRTSTIRSSATWAG